MMNLQARCEDLREQLSTLAEVTEHLGVRIERPVQAILDGYPDSAVASVAAKAVEAVLKDVWRELGLKGEPGNQTLEPLMRRCRPPRARGAAIC